MVHRDQLCHSDPRLMPRCQLGSAGRRLSIQPRIDEARNSPPVVVCGRSLFLLLLPSSERSVVVKRPNYHANGPQFRTTPIGLRAYNLDVDAKERLLYIRSYDTQLNSKAQRCPGHGVTHQSL